MSSKCANCSVAESDGDKKTPPWSNALARWLAPVALAATGLLTGCNAIAYLIPEGGGLLSAATYIADLQGAGKLPGVRPNDPTDFKSSFLTSGDRPQVLDIRLTVAGNTNAVFWYEISRTNRHAPWTLTKAMQTGVDGRHRVSLLERPVPDSREMEREAKEKKEGALSGGRPVGQ